MPKSRNIAARAGRWSATHRKTAILGWFAFVVIAFMGGKMIGTASLTAENRGVGDSGRADATVFNAFPEKAEENVLVQGKGLKASDPAFKAAVADVVRRLKATKDVRAVVSPYDAPAEQISRDGRAALVGYELPGDDEATKLSIVGAEAAITAAAKTHTNVSLDPIGDASIEEEVGGAFDADFTKALGLSLPMTLLILVIALGALVAAGVPLLVAITGVFATIGLVGPLSQIAPVDNSILEVILLVGLAVGVDYALFYQRRAREERAAGRSEAAALEAAAATSGRAVLVSGFTVMIAMAGMYLAGSPTFTSFATGTIAVVAVSVVGSLTVLPAVLSKLGSRIDKGRVPILGRRRQRAANPRVWSWLVDRVMRRPLVAAVLSTGVLVALALPALGMHTAQPGIESLPKDLSTVQTYDEMRAAFPSEGSASNVVVKARDVTAPAVQSAIARLEAGAAKRTTLFQGKPTVEVSTDRTVAQVMIPMVGDGIDETSVKALDALRDELVPSTLGAVDGVDARVAGGIASTQDFTDSMNSNIFYVFGFVLAAAFLLLLATFRSIVIPLKAIVLNLLSVGAAYGVLTAVFQNEWAESLLGFESNGAIVSWLPLFLFVILFGLSMDYHVFLLSRIREAYDRGHSTEEAVAYGVKSTAGVITTAATVMVAVFAIFATSQFLELKQMGVGLAVAVLLDATLIRGVLLPATMKLLGDWNWWLPGSMSWMPKVQTEGEVKPQAHMS